MKKKVIFACSFVVLLFAFALSSYANGPTIYVEDEILQADVEPFIENGRTYVPVRAIAEILGAEVTWHPEVRGVELYLPEENMSIYTAIGDSYSNFNGNMKHHPDARSVIRNSHTFLPLRVLAEAMGCTVGWANGLGFENGEIYIEKAMPSHTQDLTKNNQLLSVIGKARDEISLEMIPFPNAAVQQYSAYLVELYDEMDMLLYFDGKDICRGYSIPLNFYFTDAHPATRVDDHLKKQLLQNGGTFSDAEYFNNVIGFYPFDVWSSSYYDGMRHVEHQLFSEYPIATISNTYYLMLTEAMV